MKIRDMYKHAHIALIGLITILLSIGCIGGKNPNPNQQTNNNKSLTPMSKIDPIWREIDSLAENGYPKSALEKLNELEPTIRQSNRPGQVVKLVNKRVALQQSIEENSYWKSYNRFKDEIEKSDFPAKQVLYHYMAEYLTQWTQQNSWRIRKRTHAPENNEKDIRTWSLAKLEQTVDQYYQLSLSDRRLTTEPSSRIEPLVIKGQNTDGLRPNLYDVLAHSALDHYLSENRFLTEPVYQFHIDNPKFFAEADHFRTMKIITKDTLSRKRAALLIFQQLINHHMDGTSDDALIDADLKRLKFIHQNYVGDNKDQLYLDALQKLRLKYADNPAASLVLLSMAQVHNEIGHAYNIQDPQQKGKESLITAVSLLEEAIRIHPKSYGAGHARVLLESIKAKMFNLQAEQVYLPQTPGLFRLEYKNTDKAHVKIIKIVDPFDFIELNRHDEEHIRKYLSKPSVAQAEYSLPVLNDYHNHSVELRLPSLPVGQYILFVGENDQFSKLMTTTPFQVSEIAWFRRNSEHSDQFVTVVNRSEGHPMEQVEVRLYEPKERPYGKYHTTNPLIFKTDQQGMTQIKASKRKSYLLAFKHGSDFLITQERIYPNRYYPSQRTPKDQTRFFLDRAIYRPGQLVYFKGLVYRKDLDQVPHIKKDQSVEVTLYDANNQKVKSQSFTTNEFGTINGSFNLPKSGLTGHFTLRSNAGGYHGFRVEEYKRPRFEVKIDKPDQSYALGDQVTIKGKALNYASSGLDGASVSYVVRRQVQYPYRRWWGWYPPSQGPTQIAYGNTTTAQDGSFQINFEAIPDKSTQAKLNPMFNYDIIATVTDITGEVHTGQTSIKVGYVALQVDIPLSDKMDVSEFKSIKIKTENTNNVFEPAKGQITIDRLKTSDTYFLKRYWERPDQYVLSEKEFKKDFPHFAYRDEDNRSTWLSQKKVLDVPFNTGEQDSISLEGIDLRPGYYRIQLSTADKHNKKVEWVKEIEITDHNRSAYRLGDLFSIHPIKVSAESGEIAKISIATSDKVHYLVSTSRYARGEKTIWHNLHQEQKILDFPAVNRDRGGFDVNLAAVKDNRVIEQNVHIHVPWADKALKISYETFRDQLYPGQKEKWRIKISGPKADAAAAEVVASMYDASLDAFAPNNWHFAPFPNRYRANYLWKKGHSFNAVQDRAYHSTKVTDIPSRSYDELDGLNLYYYNMYQRGMAFAVDEVKVNAAPMKSRKMMADKPEMDNAEPVAETQESGANQHPPEKQEPPTTIRENLNETVFFMPELKTDRNGNIILEFEMNEALTRWKFMTFAHDRDLRYAFSEKEVVTKKELMVIPNPPRFLREFDEIEFSAKVVNLSDKDLHPNVELQLLDELHTIPVEKWLDNPKYNKVITLPKGRSEAVSFRFKVPSVTEVPLIKWTAIATAGQYADGETGYLPVVSNRMLVTETMPLPVRANETKTFDFKAMSKASQSSTLSHENFSLEFTSNPAWYAVQALPYIMEYPHECSEQIFSRLYANTLATSVANSHPKIQRVFETWRTEDKDALVSNLNKNQELKYALIEETPWVMNAMNEEEQKRNIGLLFDLDRMAGEQAKAIRTLADRQSASGGFSWFPGGRDSWYITQYIVEGFGHLAKLGALKDKEQPQARKIAHKAIGFIDNELRDHYDKLAKRVKKGHTTWEDDHLDNMVIHYLYARSFFADKPLPEKLHKPMDYYLGQAEKYWLNKGQYQEGLVALALHRNDRSATAKNIMKSLKERSITNEELGMYWKANYGYYWYQMPVETNSLMIEAFQEIMQDEESVYQLKVWLLKNKQTTHWKTTKATASAVYALLMSGANWLLEDQPIDIQVGQQTIRPESTQAGTGYFKKSFDKEDIQEDMSQITVKNPNNVVAWGAAYWQYFEDLDRVEIFKDTPLQLKKELYRKTETDRGPILTKVNEGDAVQVGDQLTIRIELRVDRAMEYVHMKDMRAAGFEPTNVLSRYKWQDGLGYYESTKDLATHFFFSYLTPGVYVFEYPLTAQLRGHFSNGVTTIQCMYAPEFTSHSEGVRVNVK